MNDDNKDLKKKVIRGAYWMTGLNLSGQMVTWVVTIIVIRLLKPEDYGLLAMATVFLGFLVLLNEIGLGPAVIQKAKVDKIQLKKIYGCVIIVNICIYLLLFMLAHLISIFFSEPRLILIIRVLSMNFILLSFYFMPQALLARNLEFKTRASIDLIANVCSSLIVLVLALQGHGVWSLVIGQVCTHLIKAIAFNTLTKYRLMPKFSFQGISEFFMFGGYVTFSRILWYFYSRADIIIAGKILGKIPLGIYSIAMHLVSLPMSKVSPIISQVGFPAFSRIQEDLKAVQTAFLKLTKLVNTISFPCFFGLAFLAPDLVPMALGTKWHDAVVPIQLLSVIMPLRFIGVLFGPMITGKGKPKVMLGNMVVAIIVMPTAFLIATKWGVLGLCYAWSIVYPFLFLFMLHRVLSVVEISMLQFFHEWLFPMISSIIMLICLYAVKSIFPYSHGAVWPVSILIILGIGIYTTVNLVFNKGIIREVKLMLSTS